MGPDKSYSLYLTNVYLHKLKRTTGMTQWYFEQSYIISSTSSFSFVDEKVSIKPWMDVYMKRTNKNPSVHSCLCTLTI